MARIETGVDKLVALVGKEKKIEVDTAARQLNVDPAVVQEWAEFLEEEGIVSLQFSLSKTFIVEKRLSQSEVAKKGKEYENKKEAFVRRVDAALKQLENETAGFDAIKKAYDEMKKHIGDEIDAVKEEMEQLRHYENLKNSIDGDILRQKEEYQKAVDSAHAKISQEEQRYKKIAKEIEDETRKIDKERSAFSDLQIEERNLLKRLESLKDTTKRIQERAESQESALKTHENRLSTLHELSEKLRQDIVEKRKKEIEPLLKISEDQAQRITRIQEEIVQKVKSGKDKMQEFERQSKDVATKFQRFFDKRARTEQTIKELEKAKLDMREELNGLIRKAKAFEITSKAADTGAHIRELEDKFKTFDKKKNTFSRQLDYLKQLITGKESKLPPPIPARPKLRKLRSKTLKKPAKRLRKVPRKAVRKKLKKK